MINKVTEVNQKCYVLSVSQWFVQQMFISTGMLDVGGNEENRKFPTLIKLAF